MTPLINKAAISRLMFLYSLIKGSEDHFIDLIKIVISNKMMILDALQ